MKLSIVVAMGRDGSIGQSGGMPWPRLPADMRRFRGITCGHPVIMGRKTWDSLPTQPLGHQRHNIVMTRAWSGATGPHAGLGCDIVKSTDHAILAALQTTIDDFAFVIGGASIYREFLPIVQFIDLTLIDGVFPSADTHFPGGVPDWSLGGPWRQVEHERREADAKNAHAMEFMTLERR